VFKVKSYDLTDICENFKVTQRDYNRQEETERSRQEAKEHATVDLHRKK
jgi:hypothetical protein